MGEDKDDLLEIWKDDFLHRREDAELLDIYVTGLKNEGRLDKRAFVLNLDAGWGRGKSFFLTRWKAHLLKRGYRVAYVDAWATDYADDPLLAVVGEIERTSPNKKGKSAAHGLAKAGAKAVTLTGKAAVRGAARWLVGPDGIDFLDKFGDGVKKEGLDGLLSILDTTSDALGETLLANFRETQRTIKQFKDQLGQVAEQTDNGKPFVVIIDELDRCRPTYAIMMLERIKHWFDVPNIVFVVATDTEQLRHATTAVYGVNFDGRGYLLRFFDRTYRFAEPDTTAWIKQLFDANEIVGDKLSSPTENDHVAFFVAVAQTFGLALREIERCFDFMRTASALWQEKYRIQLLYLLPLIVAYVRDDKTLSEELELRSLDPKTIERVQEKDVRISIEYFDDNGRQMNERVAVLTFLRRMLTMANHPLPNMIRENYGGNSLWIYQAFMDEFRIAHNNTYNRNQPPMSAILNYPDLVRSVARFDDPNIDT